MLVLNLPSFGPTFQHPMDKTKSITVKDLDRAINHQFIRTRRHHRDRNSATNELGKVKILLCRFFKRTYMRVNVFEL
jgi:hypothetical protein